MYEIVRIYVLIDPITFEIRYVGKTVKTLSTRMGNHTYYALHPLTYRDRWHGKLLRRGYSPEICLVQEVLEPHWIEAERYWIQYFRSIGCPLTNSTEGGDGATGHVKSAETRAKMSKTMTGRKHSPETRAKLSASHKGIKQTPQAIEKRVAPLRGKKRPPEIGAKISAAKMGHEVSAEARAKISAAHTGRSNPHVGYVHSEETKAKRSAALKGRPWTAARRAAEDARQSLQRLPV